MNTIVKSAIILGIVAFISSYVLSHIMRVTDPHIKRQEKEKQTKALSLVLPGYKIGNKKTEKINGKSFEYWIGEKDNVKGLAFKTSKPGYYLDIITMVGVNQNGEILGISILDQLETPGLGNRCVEIASKQTFFGAITGQKIEGEDITTPWFQDQYKGLNLKKQITILKMGDWTPEMSKVLLKKNAISSITGATITSRAVTRSIELGLPLFNKMIKSNTAVKEGN